MLLTLQKENFDRRRRSPPHCYLIQWGGLTPKGDVHPILRVSLKGSGGAAAPPEKPTTILKNKERIIFPPFDQGGCRVVRMKVKLDITDINSELEARYADLIYEIIDRFMENIEKEYYCTDEGDQEE